MPNLFWELARMFQSLGLTILSCYVFSLRHLVPNISLRLFQSNDSWDFSSRFPWPFNDSMEVYVPIVRTVTNTFIDSTTSKAITHTLCRNRELFFFYLTEKAHWCQVTFSGVLVASFDTKFSMFLPSGYSWG